MKRNLVLNFDVYLVSCYVLSLALLFNEVGLSVQVSFLEDVTLSKDQKIQLDKFRNLVGHNLPHDYMHEDIYLVRWLRARNYNLPAAKQMLLENLRWRNENDMDNILNEDWDEFNKEYRYQIEGCDLEGRPVVSMYAGDWDVRRAVVAGQSQKLMRFFDKFYEEMTVFIRRAQKEGQNVTQYTELYEMSNYNLRQHGCPLCIPIYIYLFQSFENHYPGSTHRTIMLNTPTVFQALWSVLSPLMSEHTRMSLSLYGRDKNEWLPAILKDVGRNDITWEYGGTKENPLDLEKIRSDPTGTFQCASK